MIAQEPSATTSATTTLRTDAVEQAVELLRKLCAGEKVTGRGVEVDCAAVLAAAQIASAVELRNVAWLLDSLIDYHTAAVLGTELAGMVQTGDDARGE